MLCFNPTTPVLFYALSGAYIPAQGQSCTWEVVTDAPLYCEWKGSYGDRAVSAQAQGVMDSATVRMFYHPLVYESLRTKQVAVIKNAVTRNRDAPAENDPDAYELWGSVDNVREENQYMEFKVRRYTGK